MTMQEFLLVYLVCLGTMLLCRCAPIFSLKGRQLPENLQAALNLIPSAAFAALVANDLFKPTMFDNGVVDGLIPLLAAAVVIVVARKTHSLVWCAIVGVIAYALLFYLL